MGRCGSQPTLAVGCTSSAANSRLMLSRERSSRVDPSEMVLLAVTMCNPRLGRPARHRPVMAALFGKASVVCCALLLCVGEKLLCLALLLLLALEVTWRQPAHLGCRLLMLLRRREL